MKNLLGPICLGLLLAVTCQAARAQFAPVTVDNFVRAESDRYFATNAKRGAFGKFRHDREIAPVENQPVIRYNRDVLVSSAVFDLDAGPVTVTLPDPGKRFMSILVVNQDHYTPIAAFGAGTHLLTRSFEPAPCVRVFVAVHRKMQKACT